MYNFGEVPESGSPTPNRNWENRRRSECGPGGGPRGSLPLTGFPGPGPQISTKLGIHGSEPIWRYTESN